MALRVDAHCKGEIECFFVRHAELFSEFVQADVFRHRAVQPFIGLPCLAATPRQRHLWHTSLSCSSSTLRKRRFVRHPAVSDCSGRRKRFPDGGVQQFDLIALERCAPSSLESSPSHGLIETSDRGSTYPGAPAGTPTVDDQVAVVLGQPDEVRGRPLGATAHASALGFVNPCLRHRPPLSLVSLVLWMAVFLVLCRWCPLPLHLLHRHRLCPRDRPPPIRAG